MRRIFAATAVVLIAIPSRAQNEFPRYEFFAGYSFRTLIAQEQFDLLPKLAKFEQQWLRPDRERGHTRGFSFGFSRNFTKTLGVTSTLAWERGKVPTQACLVPIALLARYPQSCLQDQQSGSFQTSFGPRFASRRGRVTHFTHALLGTYTSMGESGGLGGMAGGRFFTVSYGGGMDVALNDRFSVRTIQADYMSAREFLFARPFVRLQTGIVLTFDRR